MVLWKLRIYLKKCAFSLCSIGHSKKSITLIVINYLHPFSYFLHRMFERVSWIFPYYSRIPFSPYISSDISPHIFRNLFISFRNILEYCDFLMDYTFYPYEMFLFVCFIVSALNSILLVLILIFMAFFLLMFFWYILNINFIHLLLNYPISQILHKFILEK